MAKNTISQLDLVLLGRRGLTARLGGVESQVKRLVVGTGGDGTEVVSQDLRPNLLTNSSFEFYDRGSTKPKDWAVSGGAIVSVGSAGVDGTNSLRLPDGASVSQLAAAGVTVPHSSIVISVAARSDYAGQKIAINLQHAPGVQGGPMMRLDLTGGLLQTDDVPNDGNWYRFYRQFILTGGATATAIIAQAGNGTLEVDAAKLEKEDGVAAWLEPTAYMTADWGAATHIRNLAADNIVTGTLVVGGSTSTNPRISVIDGDDVEIVTIGDPTDGYYGIEVKQAAGIRISGTGSLEVTGGGNVNVSNTGSVNVTGTGGVNVNGGGNITVGNTGSVVVAGTGVVRAGTAGAQRVEMAAAGLSSYSAGNVEQVRIDAADGKLKVFGAGGLVVSGSGGITVNGGGNITVDNSGLILLTGTGIVRAGPSTGYHAELGAGGLALFGSSGGQTILLSSITGKVHVFDDSLQIENGGKLSYVSGLVWADNQGFWAMDASGNAAFGVSGVDSKAWGNLPGGVLLDKGDILIGRNSNYVLWDASAGVVKFSGDGAGVTNINGGNIQTGTITALGTVTSGSIVIGSANKLWFNDANDGALNIGGSVKASAPFRVSSAGALVATNATVSGTVTAGVVSLDPSTGLRITARSLPYYNYAEPVNTGIKWMLDAVTPLATLEAWRDTVENYRYVTLKANYAGTNVLQLISNNTLSLSSGGASLTLGSSDIQTSSNLTFYGAGGITLGYASGTGGLTVWSTDGIYSYGNINASTGTAFNSHVGSVQCDGWFRSYNNSGWYNESYGVGWWATGAGVIRGYNNSQLHMSFAADKHVRIGPTQAVITQGSNNSGAIYFGVDTTVATQQTGGIEASWGDAADPRISIGVTRDGSKANATFHYTGLIQLRNGTTVRQRIGNNGNIGIGAFTSDVSWLLTLGADSAAKPNGGTWINSSSDIRTKTVNGEYEYGLEAIRKLRLVRYTYNGLGGTIEGLQGVGFVAQEAREVIPEMVGTRMAKLHEDDEAETELLTLSNDPAIYATMKAVQEMADIIDQLRAEIAELKGSR